MHILKVQYRPDNYPYWIPWREFANKFDMIGERNAIDLGGVPTVRPGFAPRVPFGKPQNACDDTTGRSLRRGYDFQVKFNGTGHAVLDRFRLHAMMLVEKSTSKT
jgi:hypothetical protein